MAAEPELLARDGSRRRPAARTAAVALLVVAAVLVVGRSGSRTWVMVTASAMDSTGLPTVRSVLVIGTPARQLTEDLRALSPGRIPCGAPGPADVTLAFHDVSYDVNGECARVVQLPERPGETVWLESAALHDDLAAALSY
jgi:hypothetical protein